MMETRGILVSMGIRDISTFSCQKLPSVFGLIRWHAAFPVILCHDAHDSYETSHACAMSVGKRVTFTVPLEHLAGLDPVTRFAWPGYHR
jgi:hypothetical protein